MKKINWVKFHTRDFGLFRYYVYIESNKLPFYQKNFGKVFDYTLTVPDGKLIGYHHDKFELEEMMHTMYRVACRDFKTFENFSKDIFGWMNDFISFNNKLNLKTTSKLSNKELLKLFEKWYKKYLYWEIGIYFYFTLEPIVTEKFYKMLEEYLQEKKLLAKLNEYGAMVVAPEKMNAVAREQKMLLETALGIKKQPAFKNKLLQKYYKSFLWIPCYDIKDEEYKLGHFVDKVEKLLKLPAMEISRQLQVFNADFTQRKKDFKNLMAQIKDKQLRELSKIMHWLVFYKDHRDDLRREAGYAGKRFMNILAKRFDLTLLEINYLTPPEVREWLGKNKKVSLSSIRARMPANYVYLSTPGKIELFVGKKVKEILARELTRDESADENIIKGIVGSKGIAKGRVAIVRHVISLAKVKEGDVLVAVTTHPEYVPAMKKCCAIVTDEGGITSHAAIVARELNKPCIVATKNATQILKDGDRVEVDANSGVIKKL